LRDLLTFGSAVTKVRLSDLGHWTFGRLIANCAWPMDLILAKSIGNISTTTKFEMDGTDNDAVSIAFNNSVGSKKVRGGISLRAAYTALTRTDAQAGGCCHRRPDRSAIDLLRNEFKASLEICESSRCCLQLGTLLLVIR
jgi:hypothetical protein